MLRRPDRDLPPQLDAAVNLIREGQFDRARYVTVDYMNRLPEDLQGLAEFVVGLAYHEEKVYGEARPHFERAIRLEPDYHLTYYYIGYCLYNLGDYELARRAFETHLSFVPEEGDSHFGLGLIALEEGRFDDAVTRFHSAIDLYEAAMAQRFNPKDRRREVAKCHARLGDVHFRQGRYGEARTELEAATELWPMHYEAWFMLHQVLLRLGEDELAAAALKKHDEVREQVRPSMPTPSSSSAAASEPQK